MSIELMTVAWRSDLPSGRKLVLLSLCDNANDQGECYPSMATIAKRCGMSERAAQGHVVELQKVGILSRVERHGRSTLYTINPRRICTPAESAPCPRRFCTPPRRICTHIACNTGQSTAARMLKAGDITGACNQLLRWDKARVLGVMIALPGLTTRRGNEKTLCLTGELPA